MSDRVGMICGFLGGTIVALESGYQVYPYPKPEKLFNRLSDAKWFLASKWCDDLTTPAAIINNAGELSFFNRLVLEMGEEQFIPQENRLDIVAQSLHLQTNETITYHLSELKRVLEVRVLAIDPRYGKVALVREIP